MTVVPTAQLSASHHRRLEYLLHRSGQPATDAILSEINPVYYFFHVTYVLILSFERRIGLLGGLLPSDSPTITQLAIRDTLSLSLYSGRCSNWCVKFEHLARCDPNHSNYWPSLDCQSAGTYRAVQTTRHVNPTHTHTDLPHASLSVLLASSQSRVTGSFLGLFTHSTSLLDTRLKKVTVLFCQMLSGVRWPLLFGRFPGFAPLPFWEAYM